MKTIFLIIQLLVAIALISLVLLQTSKGGLGTAFGGGEFYRTKRGAEKIVFTLTIGMAVAFLLVSIINLLVQ